MKQEAFRHAPPARDATGAWAAVAGRTACGADPAPGHVRNPGERCERRRTGGCFPRRACPRARLRATPPVAPAFPGIAADRATPFQRDRIVSGAARPDST